MKKWFWFLYFLCIRLIQSNPIIYLVKTFNCLSTALYVFPPVRVVHSTIKSINSLVNFPIEESWICSVIYNIESSFFSPFLFVNWWAENPRTAYLLRRLHTRRTSNKCCCWCGTNLFRINLSQKDETNNKKEIGKTLREKGVLARVK
jgi:hypothetical protein